MTNSINYTIQKQQFQELYEIYDVKIDRHLALDLYISLRLTEDGFRELSRAIKVYRLTTDYYVTKSLYDFMRSDYRSILTDSKKIRAAKMASARLLEEGNY